MITCPIFARNDYELMGKEGISIYPRALIHLINKKQDENWVSRAKEDPIDDEIAEVLSQGNFT